MSLPVVTRWSQQIRDYTKPEGYPLDDPTHQIAVSP